MFYDYLGGEIQDITVEIQIELIFPVHDWTRISMQETTEQESWIPN